MPRFDDSRLTPPSQPSDTPFQVSVGVAALRQDPSPDAELVTQALHGETVRLIEEKSEFALVQMERDRYVGWALLDALSAPVSAPTHRISALRTYAYSRAHLKSAPHFMVSLGAGFALDGEEGDFLRSSRGHWFPKQHVAPVDTVEDDPAAVAQRFLNAPYLWGGCESLGLDCTGLTRAAFHACGVILPRDSDMQFDWAGQAISDWKAAGALHADLEII